MSEYPYLATLLPTLNFGDTEFMSSERFLAEAEKWLSEDEFATLSSVSIDDYSPSDYGFELASEQRRFERAVRRDVAGFVDSRRQGHDHKTNTFPTSVLKDNTPLEAERRLLRLRWDTVSSQLNVHYGDLHAFAIYRLKVQILERLATFDADRGKERFAALTEIEAIPREVLAD